MFDYRLLTVNDLAEVDAVQQTVLAHVASADVYEPLSTEELRNVLQDETVLGAFVAGRLVAFRALLIPPLDEDHLGYDIGWPEDAFARIIYQEVTNVHPTFRGHGLQTTLGKMWMSRLEQQRRFDVVCATVSPQNIPSIKDKFALGLQIVALKPKYGGKMRYIFMKDLRKDEPKRQDERRLPLEDVAAQTNLFEQGWVGKGIEQRLGEWDMTFQKK